MSEPAMMFNSEPHSEVDTAHRSVMSTKTGGNHDDDRISFDLAHESQSNLDECQ